MPWEAPVMTTTLPVMTPPAPGRSGAGRAGGDLVGVPHPQRRRPLETHQGDRREVTPGGVAGTLRGGQLGYRCAHKDHLHGVGLPDDRAPGGPPAPVTFRAIALASPWHALGRRCSLRHVKLAGFRTAPVTSPRRVRVCADVRTRSFSEATGSPREPLRKRVVAVPRPRSGRPCRPG